jgi:hypothetical protein
MRIYGEIGERIHQLWAIYVDSSNFNCATICSCLSGFQPSGAFIRALADCFAALPIKIYGMASFERFVNSSTLNVIVPNVVLQFPPQDIDYSAWLRKLRSDNVERERAFFGTSGVLFFHSVAYSLTPISR